MKAIRLIEYKKLVVEDIQAPSFGDHQVLVKVGQAMEAFQLLENEPENYLKILIKLSN